MKLLIGGSPSKIFHLEEFQKGLTKLNVECKLVIDTDICNGFPSRKISDWFQTQKKFDKLISDFKPDVVFVDRQLHFRSPVFELSGQIEFNFLPYETGNALYTWTPFVYTGLSFFHFNPQAENKNGQWVNLQELGTEGQGSTSFPDRSKYALAQFAIPIGGGLKIAINPSFNIILEYGVRKTFTDYLDDVSTTYAEGVGANIADISNETYEMSDPTGTHFAGDQRGDETKKDWYSFAGITLSFKLSNNTKGCDY